MENKFGFFVSSYILTKNIKKIIVIVSYLKLNIYFCKDVFIEKHIILIIILSHKY